MKGKGVACKNLSKRADLAEQLKATDETRNVCTYTRLCRLVTSSIVEKRRGLNAYNWETRTCDKMFNASHVRNSRLVRLARVIFLSYLWQLAMTTAAYTFLASTDVFSANFRFQISSSFRCDVIKVKVYFCFEESKEKNNVNFI